MGGLSRNCNARRGKGAVVSSLVLDTVYTDTVAQGLGSLSPALLQKFDDCLKVGLGLP
jgi:hypothetical protein